MERDSRRDRGAWKGCYNFKEITCEGDAGSVPKRNGGLKMGHAYYYYYELDGASETHDPFQPTTTTCPYLPGQTVNALWIPVEQSGRKRSASLTSLREEDFKTMDPASKFVSPRPAPSPPEPARRVGTAPLRMQQPKRPSRSPSPGSRWMFSPRKLFSRKSSCSSLKEAPSQTLRAEDERNLRSEGSRSRDISPESLRKFLVDDAPLDHETDEENRPALDIPEDIVEENEDDDNFATSAVSETGQFTGLSPPPQRALSPATAVPSATDSAARKSSPLFIPAAPTRPPPRAPTLKIPTSTRNSQSDFPISALRSQASPQSPDSASLPGFDLSEDEDDDEPFSGVDIDEEDDALPIPGTASSALDRPMMMAKNPFARNLAATLSTYSLPRTAGTEGKLSTPGVGGQPAALSAVAADEGNATSLLTGCEIPDAGLGDLVSELGWMADFIKGECA
ncbi:uncharacterized protein B0T15DRAFT_287807 [Chaetomium strumarium]|uniref:Uncharacterized protein n=1 Tax=Chaetomium strumarium TaxID=1170767 RepID=A0AAJ0GL96_9PEZI|nr:hypothetical protein B0T15DRAFT_287807 [Chaetomium strumarium]